MIVPKTRKSFRKFPYNLMKGSLLEAKDVYNTWYPVKVLSIKDEKVHVHFCNWSSRYDTWYPLTSNCLRPLMLTNSREIKDSKASMCAPRTDRRHRDSPQYEMGTYVMAVWRNDYEYLAEVLAHRQRQGDRSEYRLRYIWDNVVEWTPASKLRKASQYEIDFVLQFCKQHSSSHSTKLTSSSNNFYSPKTECASSGSPKNSPALITRSNVKQTDPPAPTSNSTKNGSVHNAKITKSVIDSKSETPFDQHDMVYDKAVLQFHEACRKRRELKRQAAMAADSLDPSVSTNSHRDPANLAVSTPPPRLDSSMSASVCNSGSRKRKLSDINDCQSFDTNYSPSFSTNSPHSEVKPPPQAKRRHELPTSTNAMEPSSALTSPLSTESQLDCTAVSTADKEGPGHLILKISKQQCLSPKSRNTPVVTANRSAPLDPLKTDTPDVKSNLENSAEPSDVTLAPIVYPCPYCPRRLRRAKLLNAHIANYHKAEAENEAKRKDVLKYDENSRQIQSTVGDRPPQHTRYPPSQDERISSTDSRIPQHLLSCHRCGSFKPVSNNEIEALLQCQNCLCWVHKTCYFPLLDDSAIQVFNCCDGCLRTSERVRSSRRNECHLPWKIHSTNLPDTIVSKSNQRLIADATELLDWTHRLTPLIKTGWTMLNNTKLPSPTATKAPPVSIAAIGGHESKQSTQNSALDGLSNFAIDRDYPVKRLVDTSVPLESCGNGVTSSHTNTEHADGFFMEFENTPSMEPIIHFPAPVDSDVIPVRPITTRVPLSTVANSVEPGYWRIIEDADGEDDTMVTDSNDALTGFLQDLGPNVLPDLDNMVDYLTPSSVDPSRPRPTTLLNGQDDDDDDDYLLSGVVQPHDASLLDTPIKEALRSANLLAPVPVSLVPSVLETSGNEAKSSVIYQLHPTTTVLSTRSPQGQTEFPGDGPHSIQDAVALASSITVAGEPFSTSADLLAIVPFRDSLEEPVHLHSLASAVSCPEKSLIDGTCYAPGTALPISSDCDQSLMGNLQVSEMDWISAPVASVCTSTSTLSMGRTTAVGPTSSAAGPSVSSTVEPMPTGGGQAVATTGCLVTDDDVAGHEQFDFLPLEARQGAAARVQQEEDHEDDYLDHRLVLASHKVNQNFDQLDQLILGPLERAITVVEAQLEQISTQLFVTPVDEGSTETDHVGYDQLTPR